MHRNNEPISVPQSLVEPPASLHLMPETPSYSYLSSMSTLILQKPNMFFHPFAILTISNGDGRLPRPK